MSGLPVLGGERSADQIVNDGKGEPGGLSGSGLGETDQIPARQSEWNRLLLDRRGMGVPCVANRVEHFGGEVQVLE